MGDFIQGVSVLLFLGLTFTAYPILFSLIDFDKNEWKKPRFWIRLGIAVACGVALFLVNQATGWKYVHFW